MGFMSKTIFLDHNKTIGVKLDQGTVTHIIVDGKERSINSKVQKIPSLSPHDKAFKIIKRWIKSSTKDLTRLQVSQDKGGSLSVKLLFAADRDRGYKGYSMPIAKIERERVTYEMPLTVYDTRHLADATSMKQAMRLIRYRDLKDSVISSSSAPGQSTAQKLGLQSDLHAHFAASISAEDLLDAPFRLSRGGNRRNYPY